jgi:hypothetical protein
MLVYIFRGPGRVFGMTADATGANLPARFAPWVSFKSVDRTRALTPEHVWTTSRSTGSTSPMLTFGLRTSSFEAVMCMQTLPIGHRAERHSIYTHIST